MVRCVRLGATAVRGSGRAATRCSCRRGGGGGGRALEGRNDGPSARGRQRPRGGDEGRTRGRDLARRPRALLRLTGDDHQRPPAWWAKRPTRECQQVGGPAWPADERRLSAFAVSTMRIYMTSRFPCGGAPWSVARVDRPSGSWGQGAPAGNGRPRAVTRGAAARLPRAGNRAGKGWGAGGATRRRGRPRRRGDRGAWAPSPPPRVPPPPPRQVARRLNSTTKSALFSGFGPTPPPSPPTGPHRRLARTTAAAG